MSHPTYDNTAALASLRQPEDFIMVELALVDALGGDHLAAILFARIAFRARRGPWRATYEDLVAETRLKGKTLARRLQALKAAGLVVAEATGGFDRGMVYSIPGRTPEGQNGPIHPANLTMPSGQSDPMDEDRLTESSLYIEGKKTNKKGSEPSRAEHPTPDLQEESSPSEETPSFEAFWAEYPRKVGKGQARKAWGGAVKKASQGVILDGLRRQVPVLNQTDPRFVPYPSTWLNGERWTDGGPGKKQPRPDTPPDSPYYDPIKPYGPGSWQELQAQILADWQAEADARKAARA